MDETIREPRDGLVRKGVGDEMRAVLETARVELVVSLARLGAIHPALGPKPLAQLRHWRHEEAAEKVGNRLILLVLISRRIGIVDQGELRR